MSPTERPVRFAVIGAGSWGINHVRVLASDPSCELVVVAEPDERRHARIAELAPHALRVASAAQAFASSDVEAVVIATPASTHVELATAAFAAGKHVLVEKPLATTLAGARAIEQACRRADRVGMVGHVMVFHPAVRRIRALLAEGGLGVPYYVHASRVNLGRLRSDETALWCFGPHDLSMIDHIVGQAPIVVSACGQAVLQRGIEDVVSVSLRYREGFMAYLHLSWLHPRKERRLTLVCSQKMVDFDDQATSKLRICDKGYDRPPEFTEFSEFLTIRDGDVHIPQLSMEEPLRAEIRHLVDCIRSGARPDADLASGVRITAVLEAAERSIRQGGVPLEVQN